MNSMRSFLSFGRGAVRESGRTSRQADSPSVVERLCADTLSALGRFTEIVEADPTARCIPRRTTGSSGSQSED